MLSRYDYNEIMGIPNHPPCDVCGKENRGIMWGSGYGSSYRTCGDKCSKRLAMRVENGLIPYEKEEQITEKLMRIRIKQLKHQLKSVGIKANKTTIR